jgi:hypothetical protein
LGELLCEYVSYFHFREKLSVGTDDPIDSFVDCDMLMRHFGHGVRHLKYKEQQEAYPNRVPEGDDNHTDGDTSKTKDNAEEPVSESEGDPRPMVNKDISSDGESDLEEIDLENSDIGSNNSSEGNEDSYASL